MCALFQGLQEPVVPAADEPKIKEVRAFVLRPKPPPEGGANPWHAGPPTAAPRCPAGAVVVEVEQDDGLVGVGCTVGGEAVCVVVEEHLAKFVEGQSARNIAHVWDRCWRGQTAQGRRGLGLHALSAVDLALWDLLGKITGEPCHVLLGGMTTARVPLVAATARPELARRLGFKGAKVALPRGPEAGDAGLRENAEAVHAWRRSVGPDFPLIVAGGGRFDAAYAAALAKRCEADGVAWFEDCVPPDEPAARRALSRKLERLGAVHGAGSREATRWGFDALADEGVTVLAPDVCRCGGPSEFLKIAALARARGVAVAPSGGGVYAYGLAMALPDVHVAECALSESGAPAPFWGDLLAGEPPPADGYVALSRAPGWGVALNRDRVDLVRPHDRDTKRALLSAFKKVTDECKNAPEPATKGRRSESAPTIRDESVMAADRALAASLLG